MQSAAKVSWIEKCRLLVLRDPKRSSLLGALLVVMLILWGRLLFSGPASATASLLRKSVAVFGDEPAQPAPSASTNPVLDWLGQPHRRMQRNLFAVNLDFYSRAGGNAAPLEDDSSATRPSDDSTDPAHQKQIILENLRTQAARLQLQTTLMGKTPRAMVNGQLLKEGDVVEGFTVVKIDARKISIQQDGVVLEVTMP